MWFGDESCRTQSHETPGALLESRKLINQFVDSISSAFHSGAYTANGTAFHEGFIFASDCSLMRLLLAEDDPTLREFVARGLIESGYAVDAVEDGSEALLATETVPYDVAILDVNLPGMDGFEVCRQIRAKPGIGPAVLFLTARDAIGDRVRGLDLGAEDYLVKPFAFAELLARIRALLRRGVGGAPTLHIADLELDPAKHRVTRDGIEINLTAKEFSLLEYLMRNEGLVVTKPMIANHVWNFDLDAESNFIEVYIYAIRKKLDRPGAPPLIHTVRGIGYRLDASTAS